MHKDFDLIKVPTKFFEERKDGKIDLIVLHCFGCDLKKMFQKLQEFAISVHYIIPQSTSAELTQLMPEMFLDATINYPNMVPVIQLVDTAYKAYHGGVSEFGRFRSINRSLNDCSIGIEFEMPGYANGDDSDLYAFSRCTDAQKIVGIRLIHQLLAKYDIPTQNVLGHSTIAVGRKTDPGPLFFWDELYQNQIGYLPQTRTDINMPDNVVELVQQKLCDIGFTRCPQTSVVDDETLHYINAYIMQFAPSLWPFNQENLKSLLCSLDGFDARLYWKTPILTE